MAKGTINKVIIVGNLGADPELRTLPSGTSVVNISIATTETWADKNNPQGPRIEQTEWHRVAFFDRAAEVVNEYMKKGSKIYVEGSIHTRKYQDKEGNDRFATEIRARNFEFMGGGRGEGGRGEGGGGTGGGGSPQSRPAQAEEGFGDMEDIPF